MPVEIQVNEPTARQRRVYFDLRGTDGTTPATAEADGQPQISVDGAVFTDAGIGVLVAIGSGRYYAELDPSSVSVAGVRIETRYKSAATLECPGDTAVVVEQDPFDLPTPPPPPPPPSPGCTPVEAGVAVLRYGAGGDVTFPLTTPYGNSAIVGEDCPDPVVTAGLGDAAVSCPASTLEAVLSDDRMGAVFTIPPETGPGIYSVEALFANEDGTVLAGSRGLLYVEPSFVFGPQRTCGLPTVDAVRRAIRDKPASRKLLGTYEFTVEEIVDSILRCVTEFNGEPPEVIAFQTGCWPTQGAQAILGGTLANLYETRAATFRADFLPYSAGGVSVDDTKKESEYLRAAATYRGRWESWVKRWKVAINIGSAWGSSPSGYYGGMDY